MALYSMKMYVCRTHSCVMSDSYVDQRIFRSDPYWNYYPFFTFFNVNLLYLDLLIDFCPRRDYIPVNGSIIVVNYANAYYVLNA
jgi:hypothetical protein